MSLSCLSRTLHVDDPCERGEPVHRPARIRTRTACPSAVPGAHRTTSAQLSARGPAVGTAGVRRLRLRAGPALRVGAGAGARTLLTGMWSDQLLFVTGYLTDLAMTLSLESSRPAPAGVRALVPGCRPFLLPPALSSRAPAQPNSRAASESGSGRMHMRARASPGAMADQRDGRRPRYGGGARRIRHPRYATVHARSVYQTVRSRSHQLQIEGDEKAAYGLGLEHVTPFLDRDVISYLMSIPGEVLNEGGVPRALLRQAMAGIVPSAILGRRWPDESRTPARWTETASGPSSRRELNSMPLTSSGIFLMSAVPMPHRVSSWGWNCGARHSFSDTLHAPVNHFNYGNTAPERTAAATGCRIRRRD